MIVIRLIQGLADFAEDVAYFGFGQLVKGADGAVCWAIHHIVGIIPYEMFAAFRAAK